MDQKKAITIITFIPIVLILAIYIGDMISCLLTDSPIETLEIVIVLILIMGTFIATILLKKYSN